MLSVIFNDNTTGNLLIGNTITSSDANQITITGFYRLGGGSANIPSWGGGVGTLALKFNDMFIQLAFFNSDTPRFVLLEIITMANGLHGLRNNYSYKICVHAKNCPSCSLCNR